MKVTTIVKDTFRKYFVIGLIVTLPFYITAKVFLFFVAYLDEILAIQNGRFLFIIPAELHPNSILGFPIPGLGVIFALIFILLMGALGHNYFGRRMLRGMDQGMGRLPMARVIYNVVKQALQTYASRPQDQFSQVVLVEFPRLGVYTLGFVTGPAPAVVQKLKGESIINVFVPTTPNPTSGFYLMMPESSMVPLTISIENAFKLIISGGMVSGDKESTDLLGSGI